MLRPYTHHLYIFDDELVRPWGIIKLSFELGDEATRYAIREIEFLVVDVDSP